MKKFQVIILFLFLVSCGSQPPLAPVVPIDPSTATASTVPTSIPPTATLTPTATSVPTITNTSGPTLTPLPTFPPTDAVRILHDWTIGTNCLLPCWGGIVPGQTSWQETQQILQQLSGIATLKSVENLNCDFGPCNAIGWALAPDTLAEGDFYSTEPQDIVHVIYLDIQNAGSDQKVNFARDLKLRTVLKYYGLPTLLLFNADVTSQHDKYLEITLVYPKRHFIIVYWKKLRVEGDQGISCQGYSRVKLIVLDNEEQLSSLESIAQAVETKDLDINKQPPKSAQEALKITEGTFFKYFRGLSEPCVYTPINIWTQ